MWREIKLAKVACSGSLTLHFVNHDCVIAETIYSTAHARRGTCLVRAVLCASLCALHPRTQQRYCCVRALSDGLATRGEDIVWLLLGRLHQPGESKCVCSSFSSSSLLPFLSTCLAYPGFSEQCEQCKLRGNGAVSRISEA